MKKNTKPVVAMLYDFDKTLCTKDMQEYTFIPNVKMTAKEFWGEVNRLSTKNKMDGVLTYLYFMLERARATHRSIRREEFVRLGADLKLYRGVEEWFDHMNRIGEEAGVTIEHFILSSGLREIIEGASIFRHFKEVFACEFLYDENGVACWPKNVVNYTTKTQFLFRINKGILDISDDVGVNKYIPEDDRPVPFRNMIYIGDGMSDVPCMRLVKLYGGYSIAVYPAGKKEKVEELLLHERVNSIAPADYREGTELFKTVTDVIRKMAMVQSLKDKTKKQLGAIGR